MAMEDCGWIMWVWL